MRFARIQHLDVLEKRIADSIDSVDTPSESLCGRSHYKVLAIEKTTEIAQKLPRMPQGWKAVPFSQSSAGDLSAGR
jgi:hypothetical protein